MGISTVDWLIGNTNNVILDNFRDSWTGVTDNDVTAYASLCVNSPGTITGATNASPIVITSAGHGLATNDVITIANVGGNGAAKGTFTVTVVDANTFSLNGSAGDGAYDGGGVWYQDIDGASAMPFANVADGSYLLTAPGTIPLTPGTRYMLLIYCLGDYRDIYNELIVVVARVSGSG